VASDLIAKIFGRLDGLKAPFRHGCLSFPTNGRIIDGMPKRSTLLQPVPLKLSIPSLKPGAQPVKRLAKPGAKTRIKDNNY
jgi:hypothetical protein